MDLCKTILRDDAKRSAPARLSQKGSLDLRIGKKVIEQGESGIEPKTCR